MEWKQTNWLWIAIVFLLVVAVFFAWQSNTKFTQEELDKQVYDAKQTLAVEYQTAVNDLEKSYEDKLAAEQEILQKNIDEKTEAVIRVNDLELEKAALEKQKTTLEAELAELRDTEVGTDGYLIDELYMGAINDKDISDRDNEKLFDGEVEFNGKDYDAEEVFSYYGLALETNFVDYGANTYLTVPNDGIEYRFVFESALDTSLIGDDEEYLTFDLLGTEVTVNEWDGTKVTFTKGTEYLFTEGEIKDIEGHTIEVKAIGEGYVYVVVDGEYKKINEGSTRTVNGIEIEAYEVMPNDIGPEFANLKIGEEVENEIEDGDEYTEDSIWEWKIDANSIGLVLTEEFTDPDDDDYKALSAGNSICLPNDYICLVFNGFKEEDTEEYDFDLDTNEGDDYIRVRGAFLSGIEDYDEIYVDDTGIYDEDLNLIDTSEIELGDSGLVLELLTNNLQIDDIKLKKDLTQVKVGTDTITSDEDYMTDYGIVIKDPENSIDDEEWTFVVPEDKLEASISIV